MAIKIFILICFFIIAICEIIITKNNILFFKLHLKHFKLDEERYNFFKAQALKRELYENHTSQNDR